MPEELPPWIWFCVGLFVIGALGLITLFVRDALLRRHVRRRVRSHADTQSRARR